MALLKTTGVNVAPEVTFNVDAAGQVLSGTAALENQASPYQTSSLHLGLTISARLDGEVVAMAATADGCGSACRSRGASSLVAEEAAQAEVEIVRFAKTGRADYQPAGMAGLAVQAANLARRLGGWMRGQTAPKLGAAWLVTMEDGYPLTGSLQSQVLADPPQPGLLRLGGKMIITLQTDAEGAPRRLRSRKEPLLQGEVAAWPPKLARLRLTNAPIEYFDEREVDLPDAQPVLVIESNDIDFSDRPVVLLDTAPLIERLHYQRQGAQVQGVALAWQDVRELVRQAGDPEVRWYTIYRMIEGDEQNGWLHLRTVPSTLHSWTDTGNQGRQAARYVVLAAAQYPFGYLYESCVKQAYRIEAA